MKLTKAQIMTLASGLKNAPKESPITVADYMKAQNHEVWRRCHYCGAENDLRKTDYCQYCKTELK